MSGLANLRRLAQCIRAAAFLCVATIAAAVGAGEARSPGGKPPPDTTTWILISEPRGQGRREGPRLVGIQLHAIGSPDGREVTSSLNPATDAVGEITDAHEDVCDCVHFHGELFTRPDPDSGAGCGWGCVIPLAEAPAALAHLSAAITFEVSAHDKLLSDDLPGAVQDLMDATDSLDEALESAPQAGQGRWTPKDKRDYRGSLKEALKLDQKAWDRAEDAQQAKGRDRDRLIGRAEDKIEDALKLKRQMVQRLVKKLQLLP